MPLALVLESRFHRQSLPTFRFGSGSIERAAKKGDAQPAAGGGAAAERDAAVKVLVEEFVAAIVWG